MNTAFDEAVGYLKEACELLADAEASNFECCKAWHKVKMSFAELKLNVYMPSVN
jgi:hypothetical protein